MIGKLKIFFIRLAGNRLFQHLLFWCLSFLILTNIFKVSAEIEKIDLIYTAIFHLPIVLIVYINLNVLFPLLLERGRYFMYVLTVLISIASGAVFYLFLFNFLVDWVFPGYYFIAYYSFWDISLFLVVYILATGLFRLARGYFRLQEIEKEKTLSELKALKSQINPHFLFNSLNSIYSLARKKPDTVPDKIIQLSDLMRHIIYESENDFISLEKEVEMVTNYIELQNLRTEEKNKIEFEISGEMKDKKIAPLLFLPFVENSFKHGLKGGDSDGFVVIKIRISGTSLVFEIENSNGNPAVITNTKYKGIGIENVKRRLDFIYPGMHSLQISNNEKIFKVVLQLQLK